MKIPFSAPDVLAFHDINGLSASSGYIACAIEVADRDHDGYSSRICLIPFNAHSNKYDEFGTGKSPRFAPSTSSIGFIRSEQGGGPEVFVRARGTEPLPLTRSGGTVRSFAWSPDSRQLLFTAEQQVNPDSKGERGPTDHGKVPHVVWRLPYKAESKGFTLDREIHLFVLDIDTGRTTQLTDGPFDVAAARFSPDGSRIAYSRTRLGRQTHRTDIWVIDRDGANDTQISNAVASVQSPIWSPDGRWIVFAGSEKEGNARYRLWRIDTESCHVSSLGDEASEVASGESIHWSADSRKVYFINTRRGLQEVASIDIIDGRMDTLVSGERHVLELTKTPDRLVFTAASATRPVEIYACDLDGTNESCLTNFNSWWNDRAVPRVSFRKYDVPDGKGGQDRIDGWLFLPSGRTSGPVPLLIDVHGGPESITLVDPRKTFWRYVLTSSGWGVLALNAVGSGSYGLEFTSRLKGKWGVLDLPQHMAAVKTLQNEDVADERLAIYGKSYGGYLAAWSITQTDLFKAAVIAAPVANLESHFGTSDTGYYVIPSALGESTLLDRAIAQRLSPVQHMHRVQTPTLLLQGMDDQRCPVGQSEEIFAALMRDTLTEAQMILYPGENHHLVESGSPSYRIDYITRLVAWVRKWSDRPPSSR